MFMSDHPLAQEDFEDLHGLRCAIRRFLHFSEEAAREVGIEPQQHQLLLAIKAQCQGTLRVADIAAALCIRHHSAVELVDRTTRQGLVLRERSARDRREVYVLLTEAGEELLLRLTMHHRDELRRQGPALAAALDAVLRRVQAGPHPEATGAGR